MQLIEEIAKGHNLQTLELTESQKDTLVILKKMGKICSDLNLTYWCMYGTLIGAVRCNGFIPWDDDVDTAMPRSDYEKLLAYFQSHDNNVDGLYLDHYSMDETAFFPIMRICDRDHLLRFAQYGHSSGLFIDIYPFDGMGNDDDKAFWTSKKMSRKLFWLRHNQGLHSDVAAFPGNSAKTKIPNGIIKFFTNTRSNKSYFDEMEKISQTFKWEDSDYVGLPVWDPCIHFMKKTWFDETVRLPFEDTTIPVPAGYDALLREVYGDYMQLPPEDQRVPYHGYKAYRIVKN